MQTLFRLTWSHARGIYWLPMRSVAPGTEESWIRVFKADEPNATFVVADKAPKIRAGDESRALHVATL